MLFTIAGNAQTYKWKYAKQGGGESSSSGTGFDKSSDEMILDSRTDAQNNSYFLARLKDQNPTLFGSPITTYGTTCILLFSTDCAGNLRWSRVIGGGGGVNNAKHIEIDNNGGVYVLFYTANRANITGQYLPPRFGDNDVFQPVYDITVDSPYLKSVFLLKYSASTGQETWRKDFQSNVNRNPDGGNALMDTASMTIDSSGVLHVIVGLLHGNHLDGTVTVPNTFQMINGSFETTGLQYYLVKYNGAGNIIEPPKLLPTTKLETDGKKTLVYDQPNSRYYLGGVKSTYPVSYNGIAFSKPAFLLCFDTSGGELWRRDIQNTTSSDYQGFYDIKKKDNYLYVSGYYTSTEGIATFNGNPLPVTVGLNNNFLMKLTPDGNLVWMKKPTGAAWLPYPTAAPTIYRYDTQSSIAFSGNEVILAKGSLSEIWDSFSMPTTGSGNEPDPLLLRFNKDTGDLIAAHPVLGDFGHQDEFTSLSVDSDGNYILGGFFESQIFTDSPNGVGPLVNPAPGTKTNFFVAKLAKTDCTNLGTAETAIKDTDVSFYPNPVEDIINIKTSHEIDRYQIVTADGRLVHEGDFKNRDYRLNLKELTTGVYYLKVSGKDFATAGKVIKK